LIRAVVHDLPTLGKMRAIADRFAEIGAESAATPQVFAEDGSKF
jgi:hypothetical protein